MSLEQVSTERLDGEEGLVITGDIGTRKADMVERDAHLWASELLRKAG